jgi:hypothetical protein
MKLIIDIPEVYYEALSKTEEIISSQRSGKTLMSVIYSAVGNGTPLDTVKAEIDKAQEPYITNTAYDEGVRFGLMLAYQIVDRYKAESEDT